MSTSIPTTVPTLLRGNSDLSSVSAINTTNIIIITVTISIGLLAIALVCFYLKLRPILVDSKSNPREDLEANEAMESKKERNVNNNNNQQNAQNTSVDVGHPTPPSSEPNSPVKQVQKEYQPNPNDDFDFGTIINDNDEDNSSDSNTHQVCIEEYLPQSAQKPEKNNIFEETVNFLKDVASHLSPVLSPVSSTKSSARSPRPPPTTPVAPLSPIGEIDPPAVQLVQATCKTKTPTKTAILNIDTNSTSPSPSAQSQNAGSLSSPSEPQSLPSSPRPSSSPSEKPFRGVPRVRLTPAPQYASPQHTPRAARPLSSTATNDSATSLTEIVEPIQSRTAPTTQPSITLLSQSPAHTQLQTSKDPSLKPLTESTSPRPSGHASNNSSPASSKPTSAKSASVSTSLSALTSAIRSVSTGGPVSPIESARHTIKLSVAASSSISPRADPSINSTINTNSSKPIPTTISAKSNKQRSSITIPAQSSSQIQSEVTQTDTLSCRQSLPYSPRASVSFTPHTSHRLSIADYASSRQSMSSTIGPTTPIQNILSTTPAANPLATRPSRVGTNTVIQSSVPNQDSSRNSITLDCTEEQFRSLSPSQKVLSTIKPRNRTISCETSEADEEKLQLSRKTVSNKSVKSNKSAGAVKDFEFIKVKDVERGYYDFLG